MSLKNLIESIPSTVQIKAESAPPAACYLTNCAVFTWGAMTFNEIMMLIATILGVATFFVNLHFQRRRDRREQELHGQKMAERRKDRPASTSRQDA